MTTKSPAAQLLGKAEDLIFDAIDLSISSSRKDAIEMAAEITKMLMQTLQIFVRTGGEGLSKYEREQTRELQEVITVLQKNLEAEADTGSGGFAGLAKRLGSAEPQYEINNPSAVEKFRSRAAEPKEDEPGPGMGS